jgi:superfamily II DNA or RNA helicase
MTFELRPYQTEAVQNLRSALARKIKRLMLCSATGSGKTEIAMDIVRGAVSKRKKVLFLCNRVNLVSQTSRRFARAGISHGILQGENTSRLYENVVIACIKSVARRGLGEFDLVVIDEAHGCAGATEYHKLMIAMKGKPIIGLSATPYSKGLGKHFDELDGPLFQEMIGTISIQELIDQGYLVDCDVYSPSKPDLSKVKVVAGEYNQEQLGEAVDKPKLIGDIVEQWKKHAYGLKTVCFATNIAHSQHIVEQFVAANVKAEHIDCYTEDAERDAILARVAAGETTVISNVGILCEGWDFPACKCLILARPTKSLIRYLQMIGRILRPFEGKDKGLVLDHSGTVEMLGFPTDEFPMILDDGKPKATNETEDRERKDQLPKRCPSCSFMKKTHKCPVCGFAPEKVNTIEHAVGELMKLEKTKKLPTADKRQLYAELLSIAKDRKWSDGRLSNVFRDIAGTWPNAYKNEAAKPASQKTLAAVQHLAIKFAKSKG